MYTRFLVWFYAALETLVAMAYVAPSKVSPKTFPRDFFNGNALCKMKTALPPYR